LVSEGAVLALGTIAQELVGGAGAVGAVVGAAEGRAEAGGGSDADHSDAARTGVQARAGQRQRAGRE